MSTTTNITQGTVKQVMSGDTVVIRGNPKGKLPPEQILTLSNIIAPKLAKRPPPNSMEESKEEEPFAWETREFLRKKLIGKVLGLDLIYQVEKPGNKEYHVLYLGKDTSAENLNETLIKEGLVTLRASAPANYKEFEEQAKLANKGRYSKTPPVVRDVKWNVNTEIMQQLIDKFEKKPIKTIIENVRDGSTVRCFVTPDEKTYYNITLMMAGIKCPGFMLVADNRPDMNEKAPYADEARYFVETRLLQRDVEITLDAISGQNLVGSILHPKGNIAEFLLIEGYAKCFDWTIQYAQSAEKLRAAERQAKEKRLRLWKDWQPSTPQIAGADKEFAATVVEIVNGDALMVKLGNGAIKKIFLASIRPPRLQGEGEPQNKEGPPPPLRKLGRPLYEIPWMFEAREFLRKKLIGKKVNITTEYIQQARDGYPEKVCCTILTSGGTNVAEALVSKGLATVIKNRQDDDQRSVHWDKLNTAQNKALKSQKGVHAKKDDIPIHRVNDYSSDSSKAKAIFPHLKRGSAKTEGLVEFVASGSRLRLYIPKDSCLITLLLAGISCPRAPRQSPGGTVPVEGEPFGEEALQFTKERCLQREVEFQLETLDKAGNFIGWLWIENVNLSLALVEEGLSTVHHFSAERSEHYRVLINAETAAKEKRLNIWKDYKEEDESNKQQEEDTSSERKVNHQKAVVIEVTDDLRIYTQQEEQCPKLDAMLAKMRQELSHVLVGAYTPKRGELCAAKFAMDGQWYRARIEKVMGNKVKVFYVDYGNRAEVETTHCAALPPGYSADKPFATEYALAFVKLSRDIDYQQSAISALREDLLNSSVLLNVEYKTNGLPHVTLSEPTSSKLDIVLQLVEQGYLLVDKRNDRRLQKVIQDYQAAEEKARKAHKMIWEHGDITEDDDKEFGLGR